MVHPDYVKCDQIVKVQNIKMKKDPHGEDHLVYERLDFAER